jgi:hypothetical protein
MSEGPFASSPASASLVSGSGTTILRISHQIEHRIRSKPYSASLETEHRHFAP